MHLQTDLLCSRGLEYINPTSRKKGCSDHDTKLYLIIRLQLWISEEWRVLLHDHYSYVHSELKLTFLLAAYKGVIYTRGVMVIVVGNGHADTS